MRVQTTGFYYLIKSCIVLAIFNLAACSKDAIIHEDIVIDGNTPPPVYGVSDLQLNSYINNLYIDMFGRAPTEDELTTAKETLKENNYTAETRKSIIGTMMQSYEYYKNINVLTSQKMLVDVDSLTVQATIDLYNSQIAIAELIGDSLSIFYLEYYLERCVKLKEAPAALYANTITISEYFRRYIDNEFYDEVNMGSENFVVSCFENLFQRAPTDAEKASGIFMVDGGSAEVLLSTGDSKTDFINIVSNALEFYQGIVIEAFETLLAREPDSYEMNLYAETILASGNFNAMKTDLFISEEYAGF